MVKAIWNGTVIAASEDTKLVDGNHYFPPEDVDQAFLKESAKNTRCGWKGTASYYSIEVDGKTNEDAAWFYPTPKSAAAELKNHIAFWRGVEVG